ncbi:MAG: hypothetical protein HY646_05020 [Acidobacteria bacterium]|nr:hypothetical protein [Acidobacteriota bacterium]
MDWSAFLRDVSIIIACATAVFGIDAWRREFRGKRQIELAEETLALFYEARDAIRHIRSPGAWASEGRTRKGSASESEEEKRLLDTAFVAIERYQKYQELFNKLHSMRYRFMAQFGVERAKPFDDLRTQIDSILTASHMLSMMWTRDHRSHGSHPQSEEYRKQIEEFEKVLWEGSADDPIKPEIERIVREIEATCRGIITSKGTLFAMLNAKVTRS